MVPLSMLARRFVTEVTHILSAIDVAEQEPGLRRTIRDLKVSLADMRLDVRDYELAETRAEQLQYAHAAIKRLEQIRADMLSASGHGILSSTEIAQLTAQLDKLIDDLA